MKIGIVTDSTCDLPSEIIDRLQITVVPMVIHFGNESYLDGVNLTRQEFYEKLSTCEELPTTATPGPDAFQQVYTTLAESGATHILSFHIASTLSAVASIAEVASLSSPVPVTVVDSGSLTLGTGFLAETAAQAAASGKGVDEILALVDAQKARTHVFAVLETLEYLRRGGRMNAAVATFGTWLKVKPLLKMHIGETVAEKVRTTRRATQRLIELLMERLPLERVALVHTNASGRAAALKESVRSILPPGPILSVDVTPLFGVHLGPGAVGFACITRK